MAFGLFNSGAAAAYARSFTPWQANGGFDNVKSDIGKEMFSQIPFLNFKAEVEMAKAGLAGYTGAKKQQMVNDSAERVMDKKIEYWDRNREDVQKEKRKGALVSMLGGGGVSRSIANRGGTDQLRGVLSGGNGPLADTLSNSRTDSAITADVMNQIAPGKAAAITAIRSRVDSSTPTPQLQLPQAQPQAVQPTAPAPVTSGSDSEFDFDQALTKILERSTKK